MISHKLQRISSLYCNLICSQGFGKQQLQNCSTYVSYQNLTQRSYSFIVCIVYSNSLCNWLIGFVWTHSKRYHYSYFILCKTFDEILLSSNAKSKDELIILYETKQGSLVKCIPWLHHGSNTGATCLRSGVSKFIQPDDT